MLTNLIECIDSHDERTDIVTSNFYSEDAEGRISERQNNVASHVLNGDEFFRLIMSDEIPHYIFPRLYRREFLINSGYLDYPEVSLAEDLMTNAFLGLHNPCAVFSETVNYHYRYNSKSLTKKAGERLLEQVKVLGYMEEYLISSGVSEKYNDLMNYQYCSYVTAYLSFRVQANIKRKIFAACHEKIKNFKDNPYSRKRFSGIGRTAKIQFMGYLNHPYLMFIAYPLLRFGSKVKRKLHSFKLGLHYRRKLKAITRE
jgi:hypothetical protein